MNKQYGRFYSMVIFFLIISLAMVILISITLALSHWIQRAMWYPLERSRRKTCVAWRKIGIFGAKIRRRTILASGTRILISSASLASYHLGMYSWMLFGLRWRRLSGSFSKSYGCSRYFRSVFWGSIWSVTCYSPEI